MKKEYAPISVIIPCYNASLTLNLCFRSVVEQSFPPKEILLIDDASNDGGKTKNIIENFLSKRNDEIIITSFYLDSNKGPGYARNLGWENASQKYIAFLDSDDVWHKRKLEIQWGHINSVKNPVLIASKCYSRKADTTDFNIKKLKQLQPNCLLWGNPICTSTVILDKSVTFRFSQKYFSEDFMLWAHIICSHKRCYLSKNILTYSINTSQTKRLSEHFNAMLSGELEVLRWLTSKNFNAFIYLVASFWSILKYLRRLLINRKIFE